MLGINYRKIKSNSVGYKTDYEMFSLDFEEFLWAKSYDNSFVEDMLEHMRNLTPFNEVQMSVCSSLFLDYCILGGMPAVVREFIAKGTFEGSLEVQRQLITDYKEDIRKYAEGIDQTRIMNVFNHIPAQLAKDNKGRTNFDVYKLAQGVGRTRGNRAGGVDLTPTWRNCILTTGESPLTGTASGAGAVNRVIDIECKSSQAVIKDGMRISNSVKRNFGFAGRKFVDRLYQPGVVDQVSERYRELFRILSDRDTTEKQAMAAASIILADELACQWIFGGTQQPLTIEQISEFLASKAAVSAGDRGYKYLCDWVTQNSNKLCGRSENPNIEVLGALEDGRAYIIRSVFERILQDAGYSTAAMISYLKQSNLIETRGRANTKGKRINGIPTECFCLWLPSVELDDEADPDEQPL